MPTTVESPRSKVSRAAAVAEAPSAASGSEPLLISAEGKPDVKSLNLKLVVNNVLDAHGRQLANVPAHKAMLLQREVLRVLREQLEATETGSLNIPWLGNFKVHPARPERDGQPARGRRVTFTPARARPADAQGTDGAEAMDSGPANH